jgi:hypothetical protein
MGVLLLTGIMLTGCTKDNTMDEIVKPAEQEKTTDDFIEALKAIDGVRDVVAETTSSGEETVYYFYFRQPINHANPDAGTFDQQVAISFKGYDKDVVLHTHGYTIYDISNFYRDDLSTHLGANQVNVEHRYFGNSLPEPALYAVLLFFVNDRPAHFVSKAVAGFALHRDIRFIIIAVIHLLVRRYSVQTANSVVLHYDASFSDDEIVSSFG